MGDERRATFPPILKRFSWTLAAPIKEEKYSRMTSDSIANNYSPSARDISIKELKIASCSYFHFNILHYPHFAMQMANLQRIPFSSHKITTASSQVSAYVKDTALYLYIVKEKQLTGVCS
jgi:CRISPR/Cas system-associated exonuclease Cas4 (RecB family)